MTVAIEKINKDDVIEAFTVLRGSVSGRDLDNFDQSELIKHVERAYGKHKQFNGPAVVFKSDYEVPDEDHFIKEIAFELGIDLVVFEYFKVEMASEDKKYVNVLLCGGTDGTFEVSQFELFEGCSWRAFAQKVVGKTFDKLLKGGVTFKE